MSGEPGARMGGPGGPSLEIDLSGLEGKWTLRLGDPPDCAVCGQPVGGDHDDEGVDEETTVAPEPEVPLLLFRGEGKAMVALAMHFRCANTRMPPGRGFML